MGIRDLRFGDAFTTWGIGFAMGAVVLYALSHIKSVETTFGGIKQANRAMVRAYPSYFWDLRDPGATQASFDGKSYSNYNGVPVDGLLSGVDFDPTNLRFSALGGYEAPKNL